MRKVVINILAYLILFAIPSALQAQNPTSREIPFDFVFSHLPFGSTQTITVQVWDAATGGRLIFSEVHPNVKVGFFGEIDFVLGSLTSGGIPVSDFPSGESRYLDVLDVRNTSVLLKGRVPLYANAFALTPGPSGPQGPAGPQGPQGPSGANGLSGGPGPQGLQGPQGPQGAPGLVNRGPWNLATAYKASDAVTDNGSYWLAKFDNNSSEPSATNSNWQQLAAAGTAGAAGAAGAAGPTGPKGDTGATGATGAAGPAGPQGPKGDPGVPGSAGVTGPAGPSGPIGPQGPTGPPGSQNPNRVFDTSVNGFNLLAGAPVAVVTLDLPGSSSPTIPVNNWVVAKLWILGGLTNVADVDCKIHGVDSSTSASLGDFDETRVTVPTSLFGNDVSMAFEAVIRAVDPVRVTLNCAALGGPGTPNDGAALNSVHMTTLQVPM
jgi:hypothetical protein